MDLTYRPRRLRRTAAIRSLVRETALDPGCLIYPMFVMEGEGVREPIDTMPGQFRVSIDELVKEADELLAIGVPAVNLFGYCEQKDEAATEAYNPDGLIPRAIRALKQECPDLCVQTDVALDPYSVHGHDGLVIDGEVVNDQTVEVLCRMSLAHAEAGVDWVAPSDMMDGRVGAIRQTLDDSGHDRVGILAYSAKYASCFYGPFRGALKSAPKKGDKKSYQMDPANVREALEEARLDAEEGADILMVKPALPNLDVLAALRAAFNLPLAAYQVSGEYAMIRAAGRHGWIDEEAVMWEATHAIKRAGADLILTYFAKELARQIQ